MGGGFGAGPARGCARCVRQRLRIFPPDFGDSTYMVSVSLDRVRAAVDSLDRLLAHLSYRGVFEAEFKYDPRHGQFKLLEGNGRPWHSIGLPASLSRHFSAMPYRHPPRLPFEP